MWDIYLYELIPKAARSRARIYGRSHAGIASSNLAGDMDVFLFRLLCVCNWPVTRPAVLMSATCLNVIKEV